MSIPSAPKIELIEATETEIQVQFKAEAGHSNYELQWKEVQQPWDSAGTEPVVAQNGKTKAVATNLNPGTSYCIRLVIVAGDKISKGPPGPELIIDTEQVGCTPKQSSVCLIL
ncbi:expressed unknown protein [Seminavis robusta]|uniref:Fibronectin type-III domain-containing protein n=1 Tax=Seminavis robusta TaxID=568900 RepID=A0A9N8DAS3_9STRA|nr:expressed unknown protein [Seminavis robusta]|eukprot:Sro68_g038040.1 n/a (113) ;mRNA; f:46019-46813